MPSPAQLLLDSPSLYYRAFFALPRSIRSPQGRAVNAVRGYLDMVATLITDLRPRQVVHVFDAAWRPAWRVKLFAGYKALRAQGTDPPELAGQPELICEFLSAAGQAVAFAEGFEADDVIATLAEQASETLPAWIVTGDRDLLQLVRDPAVQVLFTVKGVRELARFDEGSVEAKYGVPPSAYADFAILRGDPSDELPGLRGVGAKGAAALLRRHGSLSAMMADPPPRYAAAIRAQEGYLRAMLQIVPLPRDVAVEVGITGRPDRERLAALGREHGLPAAAERLRTALSLLPQPQ